MKAPDISIVVPILNEAGYVQSLVESLCANDGLEKEILLVDGGSMDGTREKIRTLQQQHASLKLIDNPQKHVSQGFNKAYPSCNGEFIALVGAHAEYPDNYFLSCVQELRKGSCEAVGGFLVQKGKTKLGEAIGYCMSTQFGVGNTAFRTRPNTRQYVDSVAFAVYSRRVFEQCGLFDPDLVRNQDDEFHYRLNQSGFRILMLPELHTVYYVRNSLEGLFKQYFQYGLYKPLVFKKLGGHWQPRHLAPPLFAAYLFALPGLYFSVNIPALAPLAVYGMLLLAFSLKKADNLLQVLRRMLVFPTIHLAYGIGFLTGLLTWWKLTLRKEN